MIALVLLIIGLPGVVPGHLGDLFPSGLVRFHTAISAELIGMALTVLLIDTANELHSMRTQKEALILQMSSPDNAFATEAVRQLRALGRGWFGDNSLHAANLSGANLQGAHLSYANLQGANLESANLQGADLLQADLQGTSLKYANLQRAWLIQANLQAAFLQSADLPEAYLMSANLQGAYLMSADLQGASLIGADLQGADLLEANLQGAEGTTVDQFREARSLQGAILPDGTQLPDDDTWRDAFEAWCETVEVDEEGYIVPAPLDDSTDKEQ